MNNSNNKKVNDSFAEQLLATLDKAGNKIDVQYLCSSPRIRSDEPKVIFSEGNSTNVARVQL